MPLLDSFCHNCSLGMESKAFLKRHVTGIIMQFPAFNETVQREDMILAAALFMKSILLILYVICF